MLSVEALGLVTTLLIGGVLADRYSRRLLLIGSDVARAVLVAGLALVDATGHLHFGVLIAFVALHGLGSGLFQPAFGGILPLLVEEPSLGSANALIGVSRQAALVIGPAIGGPDLRHRRVERDLRRRRRVVPRLGSVARAGSAARVRAGARQRVCAAS